MRGITLIFILRIGIASGYSFQLILQVGTNTGFVKGWTPDAFVRMLHVDAMAQMQGAQLWDYGEEMAVLLSLVQAPKILALAHGIWLINRVPGSLPM